MSEPMDFSYVQFLHTDTLPESFDWSLPAELSDQGDSTADAVEPIAQADASLAGGIGCGKTSLFPATTDNTSENVHRLMGALPSPTEFQDQVPGPSDIIACDKEGCKRTFKTIRGKERHDSEKHWAFNEFLCPKELCEKGLQGEGFSRKYRLVNHLMSANNNKFPGQGHGMTKGEAQRIVAEIRKTREP